MKFYAVKVGQTVGVFNNWAECQKSISGYSGADYKSFPTVEEAEAYIVGDDIYEEKIKTETKATIRCLPFNMKPEFEKCIACGEKAEMAAYFARAY